MAHTSKKKAVKKSVAKKTVTKKKQQPSAKTSGFIEKLKAAWTQRFGG